MKLLQREFEFDFLFANISYFSLIRFSTILESFEEFNKEKYIVYSKSKNIIKCSRNISIIISD